jgi:hypothetical protein
MTGSEADDALLEPALLVAVTANVYDVPLVSAVTEHVNAPPVTHVRPPGEAVTVYVVMVVPPSLSGADQYTVACAFPATARTFNGADGFCAGGASVNRQFKVVAPLRLP